MKNVVRLKISPEREHRELAEMEDQYRQMEQRHRAAAEQFPREQQRSLQANAEFQPLSVWEGLRTLQAEVGADAAANSAEEFFLSVCQPD